MPGGCAIGYRPVDIHLRGLRELGVQIHLENGYIAADATRGLRGNEIFLGGPFGSTVLGTANVMMAATLARGTTVIESAACEPEVADLANCLNKMGAKITGIGSPRLVIEGVRQLKPFEYTVIPDRIEAGTFMVAAAITKGCLHIHNCRLGDLMAVVDKLRHIGVTVEAENTGCIVACSGHISPTEITTQPYPGFPTDLQAQFMTLLALAEGNSIVIEKIFPDRFMHVAELARMAADLRKEGSAVIISGVKKLIAAPVMASDLRASAALVLAGLAAEGTTVINRVYHIDRGYEKIEERLNPVGKKSPVKANEKLQMTNPKPQTNPNDQRPKFQTYDLEERAFQFAKKARAFVKKLPRNIPNIRDSGQLVDASGSVGANYIEANESLGRKDFLMHIKISLKEAKESRYWLRLVDTGDIDDLESERGSLIQEATELTSIFGSIANKSL